jgi:hypothetical protein
MIGIGFYLSAPLASSSKQKRPAILDPAVRRSRLRSVPWKKWGRDGFTVSPDRAQFQYTIDNLTNVVEAFIDRIGVKRGFVCI